MKEKIEEQIIEVLDLLAESEDAEIMLQLAQVVENLVRSLSQVRDFK